MSQLSNIVEIRCGKVEAYPPNCPDFEVADQANDPKAPQYLSESYGAFFVFGETFRPKRDQGRMGRSRYESEILAEGNIDYALIC